MVICHRVRLCVRMRAVRVQHSMGRAGVCGCVFLWNDGDVECQGAGAGGVTVMVVVLFCGGASFAGVRAQASARPPATGMA